MWHEAVVKLLLERDDVTADTANDIDHTPLSWAAAGGHVAVVKLLLERDEVITNREDISESLSCAERNGHEEVAKIMRQHLA